MEKLKGEEDMLEREMEKEARGDEPHWKVSLQIWKSQLLYVHYYREMVYYEVLKIGGR